MTLVQLAAVLAACALLGAACWTAPRWSGHRGLRPAPADSPRESRRPGQRTGTPAPPTERTLRRALDEGQFVVHYQPEVSLGTGEVVGLEALLRWSHPTRGLLTPAVFIPTAEASNLIVPLGRWVLREACEALARLRAGNPSLRMNVNVSPRQLVEDRGWAEAVVATLQATGNRPGDLTLEITETAMMREPAYCRAVLEALRDEGVRVAIDDFGTGYSSLACLSDLPASILKLDRRFVGDLHRGGRHEDIIRYVLDLAAALGMTVTAEGIETPQQSLQLQLLGCTRGQGYYFSRPFTEEVILQRLLREPPRQARGGLPTGLAGGRLVTTAAQPGLW